MELPITALRAWLSKKPVQNRLCLCHPLHLPLSLSLHGCHGRRRQGIEPSLARLSSSSATGQAPPHLSAAAPAGSAQAALASTRAALDPRPAKVVRPSSLSLARHDGRNLRGIATQIWEVAEAAGEEMNATATWVTSMSVLEVKEALLYARDDSALRDARSSRPSSKCFSAASSSRCSWRIQRSPPWSSRPPLCRRP